MEVPIPYRIHAEVSTEEDVWEGAVRCTKDTADTMRVQAHQDNGRDGHAGSRTSMH